MDRGGLPLRPVVRRATPLLAAALLTGACASVAVHGIVEDERGSPVITATFSLRPTSGAPELAHAAAERNGCFDLYERVPGSAREYTVEVAAPGYKPLSLTVPTRRQVLLLVMLVSDSSGQDSSARPITPAERARLYGVPCEPPVMGGRLSLH